MLTVGSSFNFKKNNFSFLRFFFAVLILYSHTFLLGGFGQDPLSKLPGLSEGIARIAVYGFFIISGFLVTRSLINSKNVFTYGFKRFLRVFPGFWVNLALTSFGFAGLLYFSKNNNLTGFLGDQPEGPFSYIKGNFVTLMHQYNILNLLEKNPYPNVFNGSLWTLFLEVKAYLLLGVIGIFGLGGKQKYIVFLIFVFLWLIIILNIPVQSSSNKFIRLIIDEHFLLYATYFFAGSVFYLFKEIIPLSRKLFYVSLITLVLTSILGLTHQSLPILFPIILIYLANKLPFRNFDKHGDFSYGIYLYAFPIQQLVTYFNFNHDVISYFILCFCLTFLIAVGSWYLAEKPFLKLKKFKSIRV